MRKGIILCGGLGTRLKPLTEIFSKHLLPIYNQPMIYYPLFYLLKIGVKEIMFIADKDSLNIYKKIFKNGRQFDAKFFYKVQTKPRGIAEAYVLANKFLAGKPSVMILGDNIFYGDSLIKIFEEAYKSKKNSLFVAKVNDPNRYGVLEIKKKRIIEKPKNFVSNYAVVGVYFLDKDAPKFAKNLKPSNRLELEITDLNNLYLKRKNVNIVKLPKDIVWLDTGTFDSLNDASNFFKSIYKSLGKNPFNLNQLKQK